MYCCHLHAYYSTSFKWKIFIHLISMPMSLFNIFLISIQFLWNWNSKNYNIFFSAIQKYKSYPNGSFLNSIRLSCRKLKTILQHVNVWEDLLVIQVLALNTVLRFPSLMVPPICPVLCSGMSITCWSIYNTSITRHIKIVDITKGYKCSLSTTDFLQQKLNTV